MSHLEMRRPIEDFLKSLPRETLYYKQNPGNAGDTLMAVATLQMFDRLGLPYRMVGPDDDLRGKIVLYSGGGNLVPFYGDAAAFIGPIHREVKRLVILPHTIGGHEELLGSFGDNVDVICRERTSYEYVGKAAPRARLHLMHDMAFALDLEEFRRNRPGLLSLLVTRDENGKLVRRRGLKLIYTFHRRANEAEREHRRQTPPGGERVLNCYRCDRESTGAELPPDNIDVSSVYSPIWSVITPETAQQSASRMLAFLSKFDVVNTSRLHASIAGALLGKTVNLYANNYHKIRSVYEYSIQDYFPNVFWEGQPRS